MEWSENATVDELYQLPHCPLSLESARTPNSGYKEERISSLIPITGQIGNFETFLDDEAYHNYFHQDTNICFRQRFAARFDYYL